MNLKAKKIASIIKLTIMRLIFILVLMTYYSTYGQTKVFELNNLQNLNFKSFLSQKKVIVVGEMHGTDRSSSICFAVNKNNE